MGSSELGFSLVGHSADDCQAKQLGPLRDDQPDAAGGGVQQNAVADFEVIDASHQVRRSQTAHGHGCCGFETDGFRQLDQWCGRDDALGAVGTQGVEKSGVGNAITDCDVGHALAERLHHTGGFDPHAISQRDRVGTIAKVGVGIVQADRHMTKANFTRAGFTHLDVFIAKDFGGTDFVEAYGFGHACFLQSEIFLCACIHADWTLGLGSDESPVIKRQWSIFS
ncbi:hypothetical protein D9M68_428380 [compost metagenome]